MLHSSHIHRTRRHLGDGDSVAINCCHKIEHGVEMLFRFYRPARRVMQRIADIVYKVEANIDALRKFEAES